MTIGVVLLCLAVSAGAQDRPSGAVAAGSLRPPGAATPARPATALPGTPVVVAVPVPQSIPEPIVVAEPLPEPEPYVAPEPVYDRLPRSMAEMGEYERIAMEPYAGEYDGMPLEARAELYARQFELLNGRAPDFSPEVLVELGWAEPGDLAERRAPSVPEAVDRSGVYDALPRRMADMSRYERIAMEPYADRYDKMSVAEKAELYGRQFEFMQGRLPNYSPDDRAEIERTRERSERSVQEVRREMYKPAEDRKRQPIRGMNIDELPGPWNQNRPKSEGAGDGVYVVNPDGSLYRESDTRMESLRKGWNAADVIRGTRD